MAVFLELSVYWNPPETGSLQTTATHMDQSVAEAETRSTEVMNDLVGGSSWERAGCTEVCLLVSDEYNQRIYIYIYGRGLAPPPPPPPRHGHGSLK